MYFSVRNRSPLTATAHTESLLSLYTLLQAVRVSFEVLMRCHRKIVQTCHSTKCVGIASYQECHSGRVMSIVSYKCLVSVVPRVSYKNVRASYQHFLPVLLPKIPMMMWRV